MRYLLLIALMSFQQASFREAQQTHARVKSAYLEKEQFIESLFKKQGLVMVGFQVFLRVFKREQVIEVWVQARDREEYTLLHTYAFCASSGTAGPKRREGDLQIPEGFYHINHFNPQSNFHLSLGVSYPNSSDKILSDPDRPGGAIYIHGNCVTIGCIPITDDKIKELYILAVEARHYGQKSIPIHIFPARLNDGMIRILEQEVGSEHVAFWNNLKPVYDDFEKRHRIQKITTNQAGEYVLIL